MESILDMLVSWNKSFTDRQKLQHLYMCIVVLSIIISGLTALINPELGHKMVIIAGVAALTLVVNGLTWALARVYLFDRLDRKRTTKK